MTKLEDSSHWIELQQLCNDNLSYFSSHDDADSLKIRASLSVSVEKLQEMPPIYDKITKIAPLFDFDADTPGNGYRSFLKMMDKCLDFFIEVNKQLQSSRSSYFFRRSYHAKEVAAGSQLLLTLFICLEYLETLYDWNQGKDQLSLFTDHTPQELLSTAKTINQYCFYGRCLGFQFCDSMRKAMTVISSAMASYSEFYYSTGMLNYNLNNCIRYFFDPEARAKRIVDISHWASIDFCHSFWSLTENKWIHYFSSMTMSCQLEVNHLMLIPTEELVVQSASGSLVDVPIPMSHIGVKPIQVKLLSSVKRVGMVGTGGTDDTLANKSKSLVIHCHGGGFVAQTSRSHEIYLKRWAKKLDVPILSIDYSLSMDAPFPRALEEVLYVYGWVLKYGRSMLGTTLDKIILAGDSAGANLCLCMTLRCLELNLRVPDGIFMAYTPVWVEFIPSPSRILCLSDPVLPFGFLMRCLKTYAVQSNQKPIPVKQLSHEGKSLLDEFVFEVPRNPLLSPYLAPDKDLARMPPIKILSLELDPCLDDSIMFGKKLRSLGVPVKVDVVPDLTHGFLNLIGVCKEASHAANLCVQRIKELVDD